MIQIPSSRKTLCSIFDVVQVDIEDSIVLKEKLPNVYQKFGRFSKIIFDKFPIYRIMCNLFENAILMNYSWRDVIISIRDILNNSNTDNDKELMEYLITDKNYLFYTDIRRYICSRCVWILMELIKNSSNNKGEIISIGREEILSSYLSLAAILYGMRYLKDNKFYLYYQNYYNNTIIDKIISNSFNSIYDNKYEFIVSLKFCDKDIDTSKISFMYETLSEKYNVYIIDSKESNFDINSCVNNNSR